MLKLTIKPGEYIQIGDEIKVIFAGGSANNMHVLIDAPKKINLVRSKLVEKDKRNTYYKDKSLSKVAVKEIQKIINSDKESQKIAR